MVQPTDLDKLNSFGTLMRHQGEQVNGEERMVLLASIKGVAIGPNGEATATYRASTPSPRRQMGPDAALSGTQ